MIVFLSFFSIYNSSTSSRHRKIISPVLKLCGSTVGKPSEVMMTMTTSTALPTPPWHPPQATNTSTTPSTREASMASKSHVWCEHNNSYDPQKFLRGSPTKTSPPLPNATVVNLPVDDDIRHPQPIVSPLDPANSQEWNEFRAGFDEFLIGFAEFRDKYGPSTDIPANDASTVRTCSVDGDDNRAATAGGPEFLRVIGELEKANLKFSQLLDQLENAPSLHPLNKNNSNPQPPVKPQSTQTPCIHEVVSPLALIPDPHTVVLGASPWDSHSPLTTIHNMTTMMVENDWTFTPLPPPAPDPVNMVSTGVLWPQPCPAWKTIPFKKKPKTKHTFVRRRDQDLRPP